MSSIVTQLNTCDSLLRDVHKRIGLGVDIQTFSGGAIEIRWKRDYGNEWSDERFATAGSLVAALKSVLEYEDEADRSEGVNLEAAAAGCPCVVCSQYRDRVEASRESA